MKDSRAPVARGEKGCGGDTTGLGLPQLKRFDWRAT